MTKTELLESGSRLQGLIQAATDIGVIHRAESIRIAKESDALKEKRAGIAQELSDADTKASGFATPMFDGLVEVADVWGRSFNGDSNDARAAAEAMAKHYAAAFTDASDATMKDGGTGSMYAHVIRAGKNARVIRTALQNRLGHWQQRKVLAKDKEDANDRKAELDKCFEHLTCGAQTPNRDGSLPTDKKGNVKTPKAKGRRSVTIGVVEIGFRGACDRKSMFAEYAKMFNTYGDAVLSEGIIDAVMSNGGRYVANTDDGPQTLAAKANDLIEQLMLKGGSNSQQAPALSLAIMALTTIANEGFTPNVVAEVKTPAADSETSKESVDSPGVALGAAPAVNTSGRPRRARGK